MPKRKNRPRHARASRRRLRAVAEEKDRSALIAASALAAALLGSGLLFDSGADFAFDAPKRLVTLAGIAAAAAAAFGFSRWENPFRPDKTRSLQRWIAYLFFAALGGAFAAALLSPRRSLSLDGLRTLLLFLLLLPLGASRVLERRKGLLLGAFFAISGVNAAVSILQALRIYQPFALQTRGDREATGAFVGNVGYLALVLALAAVAALAVALTDRRPAVRTLAAVGVALFVAGLLVNQNLTSLTALVTGSAVLLLSLHKRRALLPISISLLLLAVAVAGYTPMRRRVREAASAARAGQWDLLLSYRLGPWAAAVEMARERPLIGWGPGTFEAEFVPHRLRAEIASRRRLANPLITSSYAEAHSEYLQPFAEAGIPTALLALAAVVLLFSQLVRATGRESAGRKREAVFLLAFLSAGAASAATWFPLQRPVSAVPLLLCAARAWRISAAPAGPDGAGA